MYHNTEQQELNKIYMLQHEQQQTTPIKLVSEIHCFMFVTKQHYQRK